MTIGHATVSLERGDKMAEQVETGAIMGKVVELLDLLYHSTLDLITALEKMQIDIEALTEYITRDIQ